MHLEVYAIGNCPSPCGEAISNRVLIVENFNESINEKNILQALTPTHFMHICAVS
jgi:hypothetical protein